MAMISDPRGALVGGIYARISRDEEKDRLGVGRQEQDGRRDLERRGIPLHRVYVDDDLSASGDVFRPDYEDLVDDLRRRVITVAWAWDVDRYFRGLREFVEFIDVCESVKALILWQGGAADFLTGEGIDELEFRAMMARTELRKIKRRIGRKTLELAEAGHYHAGGRDAFGYRRVFNEKGKVSGLEIIEAEAAVIREGARRVLAGESLTGICRDFDKRGLRRKSGARWMPTGLKDILTHASISGRREHHGTITRTGTWPAIIDAATSDRLRALLFDPARNRRGHVRQHLLSGLIVCGNCGTRMNIGSHAGGGREPRPTYVCRNSPGFYGCGRMVISADKVEATVVSRLIDLESVGTLRQLLHADHATEVAGAENELATVKNELRDLAKKRYSGELLPEEVEGAREALLERRQRAENVLDAAQRKMGMPNLPTVLGPVWDDLELHEQRSVLKAALMTVKITKGTPGHFNPDRVITEWKA